jgi:hypothetical protein
MVGVVCRIRFYYNRLEYVGKKTKVNFSPCLIKHHAMKKYGRSEGIGPPFLTSALDAPAVLPVLKFLNIAEL